jgi:lysophospholipid hydrolase
MRALVRILFSGAAHVGILRAMLEHGVPIDLVAGTSIGSLIGGIYCGTPDALRCAERARPWFMSMTSFWDKLTDLTYHHSAIFT